MFDTCYMLQKDNNLDFTMKVEVKECGFTLVSSKTPSVTIKVTLTATQMRPLPEAATATGQSTVIVCSHW